MCPKLSKITCVLLKLVLLIMLVLKFGKIYLIIQKVIFGL